MLQLAVGGTAAQVSLDDAVFLPAFAPFSADFAAFSLGLAELSLVFGAPSPFEATLLSVLVSVLESFVSADEPLALTAVVALRESVA
jgi:hypothetical protein